MVSFVKVSMAYSSDSENNVLNTFFRGIKGGVCQNCIVHVKDDDSLIYTTLFLMA